MNKNPLINDVTKTFSSSGKGMQYNILLQTLHEAAYNNSPISYKDDPTDAIYTFLEDCPKTSLVVELVNELDKLGYEIVKKVQVPT